MKLYTEEQVREAMKNATSYYEISGHVDMILNALTPIELPSDEEIEAISKDEILYNDSIRAWWVDGAKFMKQQILNQNK